MSSCVCDSYWGVKAAGGDGGGIKADFSTTGGTGRDLTLAFCIFRSVVIVRDIHRLANRLRKTQQAILYLGIRVEVVGILGRNQARAVENVLRLLDVLALSRLFALGFTFTFHTT